MGKLNFDYILVPIPPWWSLSRKHWPKVGGQDKLDLSQVLSLAEVEKHPTIISVGTDTGEPTVLWYPPAGGALDQIPARSYQVSWVLAQYVLKDWHPDDFLALTLEKIKTDYPFLGPDFGATLNTNASWYGEDGTWPSKPENANWIKFWRDLDKELGDSLETVKLGDKFWGSYRPGPFGENIIMYVAKEKAEVQLAKHDQLSRLRPRGPKGDIGAIEK